MATTEDDETREQSRMEGADQKRTHDAESQDADAQAQPDEAARRAELERQLREREQAVMRATDLVSAVARAPLGLYLDNDEDLASLMAAIDGSGVTADTDVAHVAQALRDAMKLKSELRTYPWKRLTPDGEVVEDRKHLIVYESTVDDGDMAMLSRAVAAFVRPMMFRVVEGKPRAMNAPKWRKAVEERRKRHDAELAARCEANGGRLPIERKSLDERLAEANQYRDVAHDIHNASFRMGLLVADICMRGFSRFIDSKGSWRIRFDAFDRTRAMRMDPCEWRYGSMLRETMRKCAGLRPLVIGDPAMSDEEFEALSDAERDLRRDRALCGSPVVASCVIPFAQVADWSDTHPERKLLG